MFNNLICVSTNVQLLFQQFLLIMFTFGLCKKVYKQSKFHSDHITACFIPKMDFLSDN